MTFILLLASLICALIAAAMGFEWFGTDPSDWAGWISLAVAFLVASMMVGAGLPNIDLPRRRE